MKIQRSHATQWGRVFITLFTFLCLQNTAQAGDHDRPSRTREEAQHDEEILNALPPEIREQARFNFSEEAARLRQADQKRRDLASEYGVPETRVLKEQDNVCKESHSIALLSRAGKALKKLRETLKATREENRDPVKGLERARTACLEIKQYMGLIDTAAADLDTKSDFFKALTLGKDSASAKKIEGRCQSYMNQGIRQMATALEDLGGDVGAYNRELAGVMDGAIQVVMPNKSFK